MGANDVVWAIDHLLGGCQYVTRAANVRRPPQDHPGFLVYLAD
jgi:hypothetical protein